MRRRDLLLMASLGNLAGMCPRTADAELASTNLCSLVTFADVIVVAKVTDLLDDHGVKVARAAPSRFLKGSPLRELFFLAEPTWTCDMTTAVKGETALLFLKRPKAMTVNKQFSRTGPVEISSRPFFLASYSGRGRMPLRTWNGVLKVIVPGVDLPDSLELKYEGTVGDVHQTVPYPSMERAVKQMLARPARELQK